METLLKLHPLVACVLIVSVSTIIGILIYQFWKTIREY